VTAPDCTPASALNQYSRLRQHGEDIPIKQFAPQLPFDRNAILFSGDTIFPDGPGKTGTLANLKQIIESITSKIFVLSDDIRIYPGHGTSAILRDEKQKWRDSLAEHYLSFTKFVDNLFRRITLLDHLFPLLRHYIWYRFRGAGHIKISGVLLL